MKLHLPLIDFAGQSRKVYQVTVTEVKSINVDGLAELLVASVHYKMDASAVFDHSTIKSNTASP